jgi:predicted metalloendopeptidase
MNENIFDTDIRAQDNFYEWVNNYWLTHTKLPDEKSRIGSFIDRHDESREEVRAILESDHSDEKITEGSKPTKDNGLKKAKKLYSMFMKEDESGRQGLNLAVNSIMRVIYATSKEELISLMGVFAKMGTSSMLTVDVFPDLKKPSINTVYISQGGIGLPDKSYYFDEGFFGVRSKYIEYLARAFRLFSEVKEEFKRGTSAEESAQKVLEIETEIAKLHIDNVILRNPRKIYNPCSFDTLVELAGDFPIDSFLFSSGWSRDKLKKVIICTPDFIAGIGKIWNKVDIGTIQCWMIAAVIRSYADFCSKELYEIYHDFYYKVLNGAKKEDERWKRGIQLVDSLLPDAIGTAYSANYFSEKEKSAAADMIDTIFEAYRHSIKNNSWLGEKTKASALKKLEHITPKVGYPDEWEDYYDLMIDENSLALSVKNAHMFHQNKMIEQAQEPYLKKRWGLPPQTVNAYYSPLENEIVFPAAILRPPFFDLNRPMVMNYAAIGSVVGHEIGHAFDDQGSKYDFDGKLKNWWTDTDRKNFKKRAAGLIKQYSKFIPKVLADEGIALNGKLTIGENIGDLGGVEMALKAYKIFKAKNPDAGSFKKVKWMEKYTDEQLFFISYAILWRGILRPELQKMYIAVDPHSPNEARVNCVFKNIDEFHDIFNTKEGDGMWLDESERVKIWY